MPEIAKVDTGVDRRILTAMITSTEFLGRIYEAAPDPPWDSKWAKEITRWCYQFYLKYGTAPGNEIWTHYESWKRSNGTDVDAGNIIEKILLNLSSANEDVNVDYLLDQTQRRFNHLRYKQLSDDITSSLSADDVDAAEQALADFRPVELGVQAGINPLGNEEILREAFENTSVPLIDKRLKDNGKSAKDSGLNRFFKDQLVRDAFIAFQAPEKRGKSWWLMEMAFRGLLENRQVAYFVVGDMSRSQVVRRLAVRVTGMPDKVYQCGKFTIPKTIIKNSESGLFEVEQECVQVDVPLDWKTAYKKTADWAERRGVENKFKLSVHPNATLSVKGIDSALDTWERNDDFIADIIVIDYADNLAAESRTSSDFRHQVNETWQNLRRVSQERHCLLVTATQADAKAYSVTTQSQDNYSEDKRKHAHVTGMVGLNQTSEEKNRGMMRLNWIDLREGEFDATRCCHVAGSFRIGKPYICSWF